MSAVLCAVQPRSTDSEAVERELRVQLAAAYRLVEHFGWSELIYGHLTVRIPGETPTFLINPTDSTTRRSPHRAWCESTSTGTW